MTGNEFGISKQKSVLVTDLERTVLDSIKDFEKIGGLEELLRCLAMITVLREETMMYYLSKYQNQFLYQKAGYLLFIIRDTLEKVVRLTEILGYINSNPLMKRRLALKGGTAINLTVFRLPRLSVDIDLDYCAGTLCGKD